MEFFFERLVLDRLRLLMFATSEFFSVDRFDELFFVVFGLRFTIDCTPHGVVKFANDVPTHPRFAGVSAACIWVTNCHTE